MNSYSVNEIKITGGASGELGAEFNPTNDIRPQKGSIFTPLLMLAKNCSRLLTEAKS